MLEFLDYWKELIDYYNIWVLLLYLSKSIPKTKSVTLIKQPKYAAQLLVEEQGKWPAS